jgi:hypothetical protein
MRKKDQLATFYAWVRAGSLQGKRACRTRG